MTVIRAVPLDDSRCPAPVSEQFLRFELRHRFDWEFFFIGANQDAALTAGEMGINADRSLDMAASSEGAREAYASTSRNISQARRGEQMDGYTEEDQNRQRDADSS